ncbi:glycosyltransferase [Desulfocapsa sulfexigens DSM 10523]|uniref:Glycosyltransferase n=1 Tax=Desulfocapsa sulfexigens (strain DSM 10523 / SB164P1) TaxID=1167006 RepID=M1P4Z0_DESSD|nr:glycosyltransferase [Desulfocapsa sulfexigens]AGF78533.1 glycosyltransferase [Desulfocapsa sulfexigens DSM 10523]
MNDISPPYKLVIVLQDLEFGGTQRYAINLLQYIDRSLFDPELWVLRGGMDMAPLAKQTGVQIRWFSKGSRVTPLALYHFFRCLARNRPTILYPLTVVPNIWARIFGTLLRVPVLISSYRNLYANQYERLLWPLSTHIICNAEAIREKLVKKHRVKRSRISVVSNGVDTEFFVPDSAKQSIPLTILYAGRLVYQKDPLTLLKAFVRIKEARPEVRLLVVGNGDLRCELLQFIKHHSLEEHVSLIGGTVDIKKYMQKARIFLLSSLYEGSPNILIEAMACGLPVVATRTSGIPELIEHGRNGYLVLPGDSKTMAKQAIHLLSDSHLWETMSTQARIKVLTNHKLKECVRLTEKILLAHLPEQK